MSLSARLEALVKKNQARTDEMEAKTGGKATYVAVFGTQRYNFYTPATYTWSWSKGVEVTPPTAETENEYGEVHP